MTDATRFRGIYPILHAFFDADGGLRRDAFTRQVDACIAAGAHGIAVLGLATEVGKLDVNERRQVLEWVAEDVGGRVPLAVTIAEPSVSGQAAFANAARELGASWVILQPPPVAGLGESSYLDFFGQVADRVDLPIAIQNAPGLIATSLSNAGLKALNRAHPNVCLLKAEGPATYVRQLIDETEGRFTVFNGYGGLQLPNSLRAGCAGLIPAPDTVDVQVRIYDLMATGQPADAEEAERLHAEILPIIVFTMSSVENMVTYCKHLTARRLELGPVHPRAPGVAPTPFGLDCLERLSARLPPLDAGG